MRILFLIAFSVCLLSFDTIHWETDFAKAKQLAAQEHKFILLHFSGSDWCGPCVRMHKEIFTDEKFTNFAHEKLVLINADFPRQKKNQLSKEQQKQNDQLADQYNSAGNFPFTLLLNEKAEVIKSWNGFPSEGTVGFINDIKSMINGRQ